MHIRQAIREEAIALIAGLTTTGANVFNSRTFPLESDQLPCWVVFTGSDVAELDGMGGQLERRMQLRFEGNAREKTGELLAEKLDAMAEELETAILKNSFTNADEVIYTETEFEFDSEDTDQALGSIAITYTVVLYMTQGAPSA